MNVILAIFININNCYFGYLEQLENKMHLNVPNIIIIIIMIIIIIARYDYNLTIMKSPKPVNDCFRRHHVEELQTCSPGHGSNT